MKTIDLIISDLDGTLLNEHHSLSDKTIQAVAALSKTPIPFWVATGRHHIDARNVVQNLGLETYVIAANGGTILNPDGSIFKQEVIDKNVVEGILKLNAPDEVLRNVYQEDLWLMEREDQVFKDYYDANDFKFTLCDFDDYLEKPINKVFFTSLNHDALVPLAQQVKEKFGHLVDVTFSLPVCLEIMPKNTNKGNAILNLLAHKGIKPENTLAFGDGLNDYEMLQVVGHPHIMENASQGLKDKSPQATPIGLNSEDAVAEKILEVVRQVR